MKKIPILPTIGSILFLSLIMLYIFKIAISAKEVEKRRVCFHNMYAIGQGVGMYCADWDEKLPPSAIWQSAAMPRIAAYQQTSCFKCPASTSPYGYIFNSKCDTMTSVELFSPSPIVIIYEQNSYQMNEVGNFDTKPPLYRHFSFTNVLSSDGHASSLSSRSKNALYFTR